jgi:hypothetical protein
MRSTSKVNVLSRLSRPRVSRWAPRSISAHCCSSQSTPESRSDGRRRPLTSAAQRRSALRWAGKRPGGTALSLPSTIGAVAAGLDDERVDLPESLSLTFLSRLPLRGLLGCPLSSYGVEPTTSPAGLSSARHQRFVTHLRASLASAKVLEFLLSVQLGYSARHSAQCPASHYWIAPHRITIGTNIYVRLPQAEEHRLFCREFWIPPAIGLYDLRSNDISDPRPLTDSANWCLYQHPLAIDYT